MSVRTINDVFYSVIDRELPCIMQHKPGEKWECISTKELYRDVIGTARALQGWGIKRGDRVAILAENRPEWTMADFAAMLIGAVAVPVYATLTGEQIAWLLRDAGVRVVFVSTAEQLEKIQAIRNSTPIEQIVVMDDVASDHAVMMRSLRESGSAERDNAFDDAARSMAADDLATIIYTSGTTGQQKGAMLTHGNLTANVLTSLNGFPVQSGTDNYLSFLPLSHVTARHVDLAMFYRGITIAYLADITRLSETLLHVRPSVFVGIPRVYEKIRANIELKASKGLKRSIYQWALEVGRKNRNIILRGERPTSPSWKFANRMLYNKVLQGMGGRATYFISGGAPLGRELAEWFADIGIRIHEGYGLTETSPVIAVNNPKYHRIGSVGKPLSNVEVRTAADGEILVRGPSVFTGYWNRPEETKAAFEDGWFKTGDIGSLDSAGYLFVTDRKKDMIKTSGGKFIAPQPIESVLKSHELISEAAVLGDRRRFAAVVIRPEFEALEKWATANGVTYSSRDELIEDPRVLAIYDGILKQVNEKLAKFETLKKFLLIPDDFTIANGFLTPTMKLRRRVIEERYKEKIEELYAEPSPIALQA